MVLTNSYALRSGLFVAALVAVLAFAGCGGGTTVPDVSKTQQGHHDDGTTTVMLNIRGLEVSAEGETYEAWLIVDDEPVSIGTFTVQAPNNGRRPFIQRFEVDEEIADSATGVAVSIEPAEDEDPAATEPFILSGEFKGNAAKLYADVMLGIDFSTAEGSFILNTPSTFADDADYGQGIWWYDPLNADASLDLPTLPDGWYYEGWVVVDGTWYSTGTFTDAALADSDAAGDGSGADPGYDFPGQDFIDPALDLLAGEGTVYITVEPDPDGSESHSGLIVLSGEIAADLEMDTLVEMENVSGGSFDVNASGIAVITGN